MALECRVPFALDLFAFDFGAFRMKKKIEAFVTTLLGGFVILSPMLLIFGGMAIAGWYFSDKSDALVLEGIPATAEHYKVTRDKLGSLLQGNSDNRTNRSPAQRDDSSQVYLHYRFTAKSGQVITGSYATRFASFEDAETWVGKELDVVYQESDPSVHETRLGHTDEQRDALYIIAWVFTGLWAVIPFLMAAATVFPKSKSTKRRRLKRSEQG